MNLQHGVVLVVTLYGTEINESVIHARLGKAGLTLSVIIGKVLKIGVFIVVVTVASSKDSINTSLKILYIGISVEMGGIGIG